MIRTAEVRNNKTRIRTMTIPIVEPMDETSGER
jgi:hypothetical protein